MKNTVAVARTAGSRLRRRRTQRVRRLLRERNRRCKNIRRRTSACAACAGPRVFRQGPADNLDVKHVASAPPPARGLLDRSHAREARQEEYPTEHARCFHGTFPGPLRLAHGRQGCQQAIAREPTQMLSRERLLSVLRSALTTGPRVHRGNRCPTRAPRCFHVKHLRRPTPAARGPQTAVHARGDCPTRARRSFHVKHLRGPRRVRGAAVRGFTLAEPARREHAHAFT